MVYLLFFTATLCVRPDNLRRDTVKNPFHPFIIALQPCLLQLLDGTLLLTLFQRFR